MFQPGDILAHYGREPISSLISLGTFDVWRMRLGPSHVSIICDYSGPEHDGPLLVESTSLTDQPCLIQGRSVRGVQAHPPASRIRDYPGDVELYRLVPMWRLDDLESRLLTRILIDHFVRNGVAYDTGGALLSGTRLFKLLKFFPDAALELVFCSELASAVLMRLGRLNVRNPTRYSPATLIREIEHTGVYENLGDAKQLLRNERESDVMEAHPRAT